MTQPSPDHGAPALASAPSQVIRTDFFLPLGIIAGLTLLVLTLGVHFAVRAFDRASEVREQTLTRNGIEQRITEVALMVVPQADWDEAVRNLDNRFDPKWAQANIGSYLSQTNGFDRSFVLDRNGDVLFASARGQVVEAGAFRPLAPLAANLVGKVREQERARPPFVRAVSKTMISKPIQASALKLVDGKLSIMTATLVQPDFGLAFPAAAQAPVVLTVMPVDGAFLDLFSRRYLLEDLRVRYLDQARLPDEAEIAAKDETGRALAYFAWKPLNPGYTMLRELVPPIAAVCLLLGVIAFFQLRRIQRFAGELIAREAHSHDLAYHDPQTGLPNKNSLDDHIAWELSHIAQDGNAVALHYVVLSDLWTVCERFGTAASGEVVKIVAQRLQAVCRPDSLLVRLSGDELAILSLTANAAEANGLGNRLRQSLSAPITMEGEKIRLAWRLGAAVTDRMIAPDKLLHDAVTASMNDDAGAIRSA